MAFRHVVRNPRLQARIFLPEWYLKIVRPEKPIENNVVQMHVPLDMSRIDVKNYLESIYKMNIAKVDTRIAHGKPESIIKNGKIENIKKPDYKVAYVHLAEGTFKYPDLFPQSLPEEQADATKTTTPVQNPTDTDSTSQPFRWFS